MGRANVLDAARPLPGGVHDLHRTGPRRRPDRANVRTHTPTLVRTPTHATPTIPTTTSPQATQPPHNEPSQDPQARHLEALFADERHAPVHAGWGVYQRLIQTYRVEDSGLGKHLMRRLIDCPEAGRLRRARGDQDTGQDPDRRSRRHPWPTLTTPASPTAPPKQLTAAWSPYAASPWDSETSLTTPSAASSTPDASKTTW